MRAYSPSEIENLNIPELPLDGEWEAAFGRPSRFERWFIDGESASGKSTFVMLLGKKLCDYGRVDYVSLEEGANLSFKKRIKRLGMKDVAGKFKVVTGLTVADLAAATGLSIGMLSKIENGNTSPSLTTLQVLAHAFSVPTSMPDLPLITMMAAPAAFTASSTSPTKSKYPGVSRMLIFVSPQTTGITEVLMEKRRFVSSLS